MSDETSKILYVSSELVPYFSENPMSKYALEVPKMMQKNGYDVRIFMPRFGMINERRHQLHEVIRLSGMNLIINDIDQPLIIKVASVPGERLQVYFIDNDEFFKRKGVYADKKGTFFPDNDERSIFFAKGVLETVKKLNWKPDIIHIHGWMSALIPLYVKKYYNDDPFFQDSKIVVSLFDSPFQGSLNKEIINKLKFDGFQDEDIFHLVEPSFQNVSKQSIDYSDAVVKGNEILPDELIEYLTKDQKVILDYQPIDKIPESYLPFYEEELLMIKQ